MAAHQSGSSGCCASISCSTGSICRTRGSKRRFMIRRRCGVLLASTSAASRCRMRPQCAASALLEEHDIGRRLFDEVQRHLAANGLTVATGTIVDATIINAPSSTKNAGKARDPEMHQTKKGNQWYFGMKGHFGVDSRSKLIHAVQATPANVADSMVLPNLLHGNETRVWGDQAYRGQRAVIKEHAPKARDFTNRRYRHRGVVDEVERAKNRTKSKVRAKVEHAIGVIKRVFGFAKVRYRGLKKNAHRLLVACALANLFIARRHLLRCPGGRVPELRQSAAQTTQ